MTFNMKILSELGRLTRVTRKEVSEMIGVGVSMNKLLTYIEKKIFSLGYLPSFPAMISVNDMAAHYTVFDDDYLLQKGDVIKVDFGFSSQGWMTDNAFTVEVGDNKHTKLIETAKACLDAAMEKAEVGVSMCEIGEVVYDVAKAEGFNTIHNLTGHQIGQYELHYGMCVPSVDNGDEGKMAMGQQFAIEPFITYGEPRIKAVRLSNILHLVKDKPIRDPIAKKILKHIQEHFPKQPFSKRWLVSSEVRDEILGERREEFGEGFEKRKVNYGISVLKKYGIIYEYDELGTVDGEIVAQFEDCVVFEDGNKTIITRLR